jgi:hypothetical protein
MVLRVTYNKKIWGEKYFFASLKSLKKEVGSGLDPDRIRTKNVTDPQYWCSVFPF